MNNLFDLNPTPRKELNETITDSKYHFFAEFVVDIRAKEEAEILNFNYLSISGDMDSDMYYSECVSEARPEDFLDTEITGHLKIELEPGVYRFVFGVTCDGEKHWTDCGYEYDAWCNYDLISRYKMTDEEVKVCWSGWCNINDVDRFE